MTRAVGEMLDLTEPREKEMTDAEALKRERFNEWMAVRATEKKLTRI